MIGVTWVSKDSCQERDGEDSGVIMSVKEQMR